MLLFRCNDFAYPSFDTKSVLIYLANCVTQNRTYSFYRMLGPALLNLDEKTLGQGRSDSKLTELIWTGIASLKRYYILNIFFSHLILVFKIISEDIMPKFKEYIIVLVTF